VTAHALKSSFGKMPSAASQQGQQELRSACVAAAVSAVDDTSLETLGIRHGLLHRLLRLEFLRQADCQIEALVRTMYFVGMMFRFGYDPGQSTRLKPDAIAI